MAAEAGSNHFSSNLTQLAPQGPLFIDDEKCTCALQEEIGKEAWRCIANSTANIYSGQTGKWFFALNQSNPESLRALPNSASNPPDVATSYIIQSEGQNEKFEEITRENQPPDPDDQDCSGKNDTEASANLYRFLVVSATDSASPCWQPGTIALSIQNASEWNATGCNLGFLCELSSQYASGSAQTDADGFIILGQNNTATDPPVYCPPFPGVQTVRLTGGTTPPMGPYEPVVCQKGNYCPPGGAQQIKCPSGHFCSVGAYEPTKCSFDASCPPGSSRDGSVLPLILVTILDLLLISVVLGAKIPWKRGRKGTHIHGRRAKRLRKAITLSHFGAPNEVYLPIHDDNIPLESRISGVRRANTGFLATMDNEFAFDENDATEGEGPDNNIQQFVQSLSRCTAAASIGLLFEFGNLSYQPKGSKQPILSRVTGEITKGSFWGIMGASGAGKSTFVNVLMGKHSHTGGVTKINGSAGVASKYKKVIGYVPQDDVVLLELTVRENILHSARIRLPSDWGDQDIQKHVDLVLRCLHLSRVQSSRVGSTATSIISGGERKRVSIGMELAAAPMALFLDEPTLLDLRPFEP